MLGEEVHRCGQTVCVLDPTRDDRLGAEAKFYSWKSSAQRTNDEGSTSDVTTLGTPALDSTVVGTTDHLNRQS